MPISIRPVAVSTVTFADGATTSTDFTYRIPSRSLVEGAVIRLECHGGLVPATADPVAISLVPYISPSDEVVSIGDPGVYGISNFSYSVGTPSSPTNQYFHLRTDVIIPPHNSLAAAAAVEVMVISQSTVAERSAETSTKFYGGKFGADVNFGIDQVLRPYVFYSTGAGDATVSHYTVTATIISNKNSEGGMTVTNPYV